MGNALYDPGREAFLGATIDWDADDIRVMLVKTGYTFVASHQYLNSVSTSYDNGRSAALTGKSTTSGVANAANTSLVATSAVACNALVIYKYNASDSAAQLICYIDTPTSGLPFTPAASQTVNITWDTGTNKIFRL